MDLGPWKDGTREYLIDLIKQARDQGYGIKPIAAIFGVPVETVQSVLLGATVPEPERFVEGAVKDDTPPPLWVWQRSDGLRWSVRLKRWVDPRRSKEFTAWLDAEWEEEGTLLPAPRPYGISADLVNINEP